MRALPVVMAVLLLACGPGESSEWSLANLRPAVEAPPDSLSWSVNELWLGVDPVTGELQTGTLTLRNKTVQPIRYDVDVQGPFRLEAAEDIVPPRGAVDFTVHFDGDGLGEVAGVLLIARQGGEGLVTLHGQGTATR